MNKAAIKVLGATFFPVKDFPLAVVPSPETKDGKSIPLAEYDNIDPTYHPHYHDFSELVIISAGSGMQNISGRNYPVYAGDVFLLQGHTVHYFTESTNLKQYNILFCPNELPLPYAYLNKVHGFNVLFRTEPQLRGPHNFRSQLRLNGEQLTFAESIACNIKDELSRQAEGFELLSLAMLLELIAFLCRIYAYDSANNLHSIIPRISLVLTQMEKNFSADWTLTKLAKLINTSERHFARLFRQAIGISPIDYLLKLRLRHAAKYLEQDNCAIFEISSRCGFNDSNYFTKKFTEIYKMSPSQYRKSNKNKFH
ncbi:MAG: AraC family transcriptional regulator [Victivallales bacterium]|nr:AraC family transcriptional regulator [Victivallales bacterium]